MIAETELCLGRLDLQPSQIPQTLKEIKVYGENLNANKFQNSTLSLPKLIYEEIDNLKSPVSIY